MDHEAVERCGSGSVLPRSEWHKQNLKAWPYPDKLLNATEGKLWCNRLVDQVPSKTVSFFNQGRREGKGCSGGVGSGSRLGMGWGWVEGLS